MDNQNLQICLEPRSISACNSLPPELKFMGKAVQLSVISYQLSVTSVLVGG
ncbi:hypothetical protein [Okeania sp. KiyG1]|uniref:hypothetical protein n=1 Tax=Okeania sp. KiyG1 TaxID=2720165 RepID=UPI001923047F|nr:hypothetical protein [Okeania sp. KiyG1]